MKYNYCPSRRSPEVSVFSGGIITICMKVSLADSALVMMSPLFGEMHSPRGKILSLGQDGGDRQRSERFLSVRCALLSPDVLWK